MLIHKSHIYQDIFHQQKSRENLNQTVYNRNIETKCVAAAQVT